MRWGPMRTVKPGLHWGTNEMGDQWELYTQDYIGNQWDGEPIRTVWPGLHWVTNETGDQWELYDQDYIG